MKRLWQKDKLLIVRKFHFCHNVFSSIQSILSFIEIFHIFAWIFSAISCRFVVCRKGFKGFTCYHCNNIYVFIHLCIYICLILICSVMYFGNGWHLGMSPNCQGCHICTIGTFIGYFFLLCADQTKT